MDQSDLQPDDRALDASDLHPGDRPAPKPSFSKEYSLPTEGMSFGEKMLAGAGKSFSDLGSGSKQLLAAGVNPVAKFLTGRDAIDPGYAEEQDRARQDDPLMSTTGGLMGYGGGMLSTLALPGGALANTAKAALPMKALAFAPKTASAVSAIAPQAISSGALASLTPTTKDGERLENMELGAALSPVFQGLGAVAGKVTKPAVQWLGDNVPNLGPLIRKSWSAEATPEQRKVVGSALINDVPVYPNQLEKPGVPISRSRANDQLDSLTKAMNATYGEETSDIAGAMTAAKQRLSDTYDALLNGKTIPLGGPSGPPPANGLPGAQGQSNYVQRLRQIWQDHTTANPMVKPDPELADAVQRAIQYAQQNGSIDGRQYQGLMRYYSAMANKALKGNVVNGTVSNPSAAQAFSRMADALEQEAAKVMQPHELAAFKNANRQFRNMKTLESLVPTKVDGQADFNPQAVARKLARSDKDAFIYGRGDQSLSNLSKFGSTYMGMDANAPNSLLTRSTDMLKKSTPILLGDALGAILAGDAISPNHDNEGSMAKKLIGGVAGGVLAHGAITGTKNSLNPRITMDQLNQPRGALSEIMRRQFPAAMAASMLAPLRREDDAPQR